jgi:hypothetical protein
VRVGTGSERARMVSLFASPETGCILRARVDGRDLPDSPDGAALPGSWSWGLNFAAPPPEGLIVEFVIDGHGPLRLQAVTHIALPEYALSCPRPDNLTWAPRASGRGFITRELRCEVA